MTLGGNDKKKVAFLCVLGAIALYELYASVLAGPSVTPATPPARRAGAATVPGAVPSQDGPDAAGGSPQASTSRSPVRTGRTGEWQPVLRKKHDAKAIDPLVVDPRLRTDLLAKVQNEELAGGSRNLFQFGQPPPPPKVELPKGAEPIVALADRPKPAPPKPVTPAEPQDPPISLKYYGFFVQRDNGKKTAFFLDGDDILTAGEGQMLKKRYKVVRIGANSVVMQDGESQHLQTINITPEDASG